MISFEIPEKVQEENRMFEAIATEIMRPKALYYDEHEHERPTEFIDAIWPMERDRYRQQWEQIDSDEANSNEPDTAVLSNILTIEMMSWGDAGQYLCRPGRRLGGTAVEAVGTTEQKIRFLKRFTCLASPRFCAKIEWSITRCHDKREGNANGDDDRW